MKLVHSDSREKEKGCIETTTYDRYYFDQATGEVTHIRTVDVDNCYPGGKSYEGKEMINRVLRLEEVPQVVREKIDALLKNEG